MKKQHFSPLSLPRLILTLFLTLCLVIPLPLAPLQASANGLIPPDYTIWSDYFHRDSDYSTDLYGNITVGDVGQFNADIPIQELTFESSDTDIVTVSYSGAVKALSRGEAVITVRPVYRPVDQAYTSVFTVYVTVVNYGPDQLSISDSNLDLEVGDRESLTIYYISPERPDYPTAISNITWSTSNDTVAEVDEYGGVTAISPGLAVITAKPSIDYTLTCEVTVSAKPPVKPLQPTVKLLSGSFTGTLMKGTFKAGSQVKLLCDTADAVIRYTTDFSDPKIYGDYYPSSGTNTININGPAYIRAVSVKEGVYSNELVLDYRTKLEKPVAVPASSEVEYGTKVELFQSDFAGGEIRYTLDRSEPDETSALYTGPITLDESFPSASVIKRIKAKVFKQGYAESDSVEFSYTVNVASPIINPFTGEMISSTQGAEINYKVYTPNAASRITYTPNRFDPLYTTQIGFGQTTGSLVSAVASKTGFLSSPTITMPNFEEKLPAPIASMPDGKEITNTTWLTVPPGFSFIIESLPPEFYGTYAPGSKSTLGPPVGIPGINGGSGGSIPGDIALMLGFVEIRYTTDGTTPTKSSPVLANAWDYTVTIDSATTFKARNFPGGDYEGVPSDTLTLNFRMAEKPATPTANPSGGDVAYGTDVVLSCAGDYDKFMYTTDGSTPSYYKGTSLSKSNPRVKITKDCVLKVVAVKNYNGMSYEGNVATYTYRVPPMQFDGDLGSINITIPGSTPMLGGRGINLNLNSVPSSMYVSNNAVKVAIGSNFAPGSSTNAQRDAAFNTLKDRMNKTDRDGLKKVLTPIGKSTSIAGVAFGFEIAGYLQGVIGSNGEPTGLEGKVMIYLSGSGSWDTWILILNVSVGLNGSFTYWGGTTLNFASNPKVTQPQSVLQYSIGVSASAGVGVPYIASVGVWGSASFNHKWDMIHNYNNMWLNGKVGVYEKFLFWTKKQTLFSGDRTIWNTFPDGYSGASASIRSLASGASETPKMYDLSSYEPIPRDYLEKQSAWLGSSPMSVRSAISEFNILQRSVYPETAPIIAEAGGKRVMVFLNDDGSRDEYNRSVLMYSVYNPVSDTWGVPKAVNDNGTADFYPNLVSDGMTISLVWQRSKLKFTAASEIEDVLAAGEIALARFNASTETFSEPILLTNNNFMDSAPKIISLDTNGSAFVSWIQNPDNDIYAEKGATNRIMSMRVPPPGIVFDPDSAAFLSADGLGVIIDQCPGITGNTFGIAYITDRDSDLETIDDRDLVTVGFQGAVLQTPVTNKIVSGINFASIGGVDALVWYEEGALRYMNGSDQIQNLTAGQDMPTDRYKLYSNGSKTSIVYSAYEDSVGYLFARDYEAGRLGNPYKLAKTVGLAHYFDGVMENNGEFNFIFNNSLFDFDSNDELVEANDLLSFRMAAQPSIKLSDIYYLQEDVKLGQPLAVSLGIENTGGAAVENVAVKVNGVSVGTYPANLKAGEQANLEFPLNIPANMSPQTKFTISVEPVGVTDTDMNDNSYTMMLGYSNVSLLLDTNYGDDNTVTVTADVTNNSDFAANTKLLARLGAADGEIVGIFELGSLAGRQNEVTELVCDLNALVPEGESYMPLYFELVTDTDAEYKTSDYVVLSNDYDEFVWQSIGELSAPVGNSITVNLARERLGSETVIAAIYDYDGRLVAMKTDDTTEGNRITLNFDSITPGLGAKQAYRISVFVWDGITMVPICESETIYYDPDAESPWAPPTTPPDETGLDIAEFYSTDGSLLVHYGDIIVVGERQYMVLMEEYVIYYWSRNSLEDAIRWWTDYMDSYAESGVVVEI